MLVVTCCSADRRLAGGGVFLGHGVVPLRSIHSGLKLMDPPWDWVRLIGEALLHGSSEWQ
ncbi:hypothetical protein RchiOBHm_Chr5g0038711 [Rosa chinensis]|uniref:Uncharacterized protein n=1 Tax=Rosa chinensis TaxID=74649 RepID=A0A2P6QC33_ROSCH|nr:hypothetical protein RchiOBHm_Chr5g0038711 [Rosa chinensis]